MHDCLNCEVIRDRPNRKLALSQEKYIKLLADKVNLPNAKAPAMPMSTDFKATKMDCPNPATATSDQIAYRSNVASLIYVTTWTMPVIQAMQVHGQPWRSAHGRSQAPDSLGHRQLPLPSRLRFLEDPK